MVRAIDLQQKHRLSFWDSMIVQAALDAGCETLLTEDLNAGQRIESVTIVNPFEKST